MRVLHIASDHSLSRSYGGARSSVELSVALAEKGHQVHILSLARGVLPESRRVRGVEIHWVPEKYPFHAYSDTLQALLDDLPQTEAVLQLWKAQGPFDLLTVQDWRSSQVGAVASRVLGCPWVASLRGIHLGKSGTKTNPEDAYIVEMERWMAQHASAIAVPSEICREEVCNRYEIREEYVHVLPAGASEKTFAIGLDAQEFRSVLAPTDASVVLYAARLEAHKGADLFLQAAFGVLGRRSDAHFVIAGEGRLRGEMEAEVERRGFRGRIIFLGAVGRSVMGALYQVSDLIVVPSRYDSSGLTLLEARLHDLPIVCSDCPQLSHLASELGIKQLTAPHGDQLAKSIASALAAKRPRRDSRPQTLRVPEQYRWEGLADRASEIYRRVIAGKCSVVL